MIRRIAKVFFKLFLTAAMILSAGKSLFAAGNTTTQVSGYLVGSDGSSACSGSHTATVNFYSSETGGTSLGTETHAFSCDGGFFQMDIGTDVSLSDLANSNNTLCIGIAVDSDSEMTPRRCLTSCIYSQRATVADSANSVGTSVITSAMVVDGTITNSDISASASIADTKLATISTAGKVSDSALSSSVSLLGQTIESSEITDGTITTADLANNACTDAKVADDLTISGGTINNTVIGGTTAAAGTFTTLTANSATLKAGTSTTTGQPVITTSVNTTAVSQSAGATPSNLMSYTLPANALSSNGKAIQISAWGTTAADGDTKGIGLVFGSTVLVTKSTTTASDNWFIDAYVVRTGSSAEEAIAYINFGSALFAQSRTTPAENTANDVTIKCMGQDTTSAVTSNEITQTGMIVRVLN